MYSMVVLYQVSITNIMIIRFTCIYYTSSIDMNWYTALYFSVDAISVAGVFPPTCVIGTDSDDCDYYASEAILGGIMISSPRIVIP